MAISDFSVWILTLLNPAQIAYNLWLLESLMKE